MAMFAQFINITIMVVIIGLLFQMIQVFILVLNLMKILKIKFPVLKLNLMIVCGNFFAQSYIFSLDLWNFSGFFGILFATVNGLPHVTKKLQLSKQSSGQFRFSLVSLNEWIKRKERNYKQFIKVQKSKFEKNLWPRTTEEKLEEINKLRNIFQCCPGNSKVENFILLLCNNKKSGTQDRFLAEKLHHSHARFGIFVSMLFGRSILQCPTSKYKI